MELKHTDGVRLHLRVNVPQSLDDHSQGSRIRHLFGRRHDPLQELQGCDRIALSLTGKDGVNLAEERFSLERPGLLDLGEHIDRKLGDVANRVAQKFNIVWLMVDQLSRCWLHGSVELVIP